MVTPRNQRLNQHIPPLMTPIRPEKETEERDTDTEAKDLIMAERDLIMAERDLNMAEKVWVE